MRDPDKSKKRMEISDYCRRLVFRKCCRRLSNNMRLRTHSSNGTEQNTFQFSISHTENLRNNGLKATK